MSASRRPPQRPPPPPEESENDDEDITSDEEVPNISDLELSDNDYEEEEAESSDEEVDPTPPPRSITRDSRESPIPQVISRRRSRLQSLREEEIRFPQDHREQKTWVNYVQLHPEFKNLSNYSVLVELNEFDVKRLNQSQQVLSEMDLERYRPVVSHPQPKDFRFFDAKYSFDSEVVENLGYYSKKRNWRVLGQQEQLNQEVEHKVDEHAKRNHWSAKSWDRLGHSQRKIYFTEEIDKRIHNGAILFLSDENAAQLQEHLDQAEHFRKAVVRHLPLFEVEAILLINSNKRVSEHYGEVKYNDLIPITIFTNEQHKTELQVYQSIYKMVSNRLASRYQDGLLTRTLSERPERKGTEFYIRKHIHVRYIAIPRPNLELVKQDKQRMVQKAYEFAQQYGDFSLISREGKQFKVDSAKLRVISPVIHRQLTTQVGSSNRQLFYRTDVSDQAVAIFIQGMYGQNFESQLTAELLPDLYNLFFELECQRQDFGLVLNEYLATQIDRFEDPIDFIESLYEQRSDDPELRIFNAQILRMRNELTGKNPFTTEDYRTFIRKELLPKFEEKFSSHGNGQVKALKLTFKRDELLKKLKRTYIGIRKPKDAYFEIFVDQIEAHLTQVIREDWPEYPLKEALRNRRRYSELEYELIPLYKDPDHPDSDDE